MKYCDAMLNVNIVNVYPLAYNNFKQKWDERFGQGLFERNS